MKKILYLSSAVDPKRINDVIKKRITKSSNSLEPIAKYNNLLIHGLEYSDDVAEITSLIGAPISKSTFSYKYFKSSKRKCGKKTYKMIGFFNLPVLKNLTILFKSIINILFWNIKNIKEDKAIIIDGSYYTEIIALNIANMFFRTPVIYSILDVYPYMSELKDSTNESVKIRFFRKIYLNFMKYVDGFIFITEETNYIMNKYNKPYIIIEGMVPYSNKIQDDNNTTSISNAFIYAGGLQGKYGIKTLVDAFIELDTKYELWLYGLGDQVEYIEQTSKKYKNIFYKGSISNDKLMDIEKNAFCLINPRPTKDEFTKYSFPSKTMEYMLSGRPVLTTKLSGIPSEYEKYIYFIEDDSKSGIQNAINNIIGIDGETLSQRGLKARDFVIENKNNIIQGKRVDGLINKLIERKVNA